jgi:hypothetical protein
MTSTGRLEDIGPDVLSKLAVERPRLMATKSAIERTGSHSIRATRRDSGTEKWKNRPKGIVKLSRFGRDEVQRARLHATAVALRHCRI